MLAHASRPEVCIAPSMPAWFTDVTNALALIQPPSVPLQLPRGLQNEARLRKRPPEREKVSMDRGVVGILGVPEKEK